MAEVRENPGCQGAGCLGSVVVVAMLGLSAFAGPHVVAAAFVGVGVVAAIAALVSRAVLAATIAAAYVGMGLACAMAWWWTSVSPATPPSVIRDALMIIAAAGHVLLVTAVALQVSRVARRPVVAWQCRGCGHDLFGLAKPRCPECGRPLDADQIANAPPGMIAGRRRAAASASESESSEPGA